MNATEREFRVNQEAPVRSLAVAAGVIGSLLFAFIGVHSRFQIDFDGRYAAIQDGQEFRFFPFLSAVV